FRRYCSSRCRSLLQPTHGPAGFSPACFLERFLECPFLVLDLPSIPRDFGSFTRKSRLPPFSWARRCVHSFFHRGGCSRDVYFGDQGAIQSASWRADELEDYACGFSLHLDRKTDLRFYLAGSLCRLFGRCCRTASGLRKGNL